MQGNPAMWFEFPIREMTVDSVLSHQARVRPKKVYVRTTDGLELTFADVWRETNRLANWFRSIGIEAGSHVAVFMENEVECLLAHIAITRMGCVSVPLNANSRGGILAHYLNFSDSFAVVATLEFSRRVLEIREDLTGLQTIVVVGDDLRAHEGQDIAIHSFEAYESASCDVGPAPARFSDTAFILFTSGTTGPSKGVMFQQARAFMWDEGVVPAFAISEKDTYFACTPLSHATGLFSGAWQMMAVGGTVGLTPRFSASNFWDQVRSTGSTYTTLLGGMVDFILTLDPREDDAANPMRFLSAAPYPVHWEEFERRFDVAVSIAYGLSDHSVPTRLPANPHRSKRGSCGPVIDGFEMVILDHDDMPVPPGQIGEAAIRARHPWHASAGYYKLPEKTLESRRNEWFHTGDRGYIDEDGYFWFVDRAKDAIRRLGENISSWEVEKFAGAHPDVAEIAAFPVKADTSEDEVAVSIVPRPGVSLDPAGFIRFCLEQMPKFMVPRFVHVAESLPRNLNQRVEKYKLRELLESDGSLAWDRENDPELRRPPRKARS